MGKILSYIISAILNNAGMGAHVHVGARALAGPHRGKL